MSHRNPIITISSSSAHSGSQAQQPRGPSTHRLATQSAAEALQDIGSNGPSAISSGITYLDHALMGNPLNSNPNPSIGAAGFERGKIAEIWGPTGAGKTAIAFQAAVEAIKAGGRVAWIDCATPLGAPKLRILTRKGLLTTDKSEEQPTLRESFQYLSAPTFSHLLALILHPPPSFPPPTTTLLVLDGLEALLNVDYPRMPYGPGQRTEQQKWHAGRRYAILGTFVTALSKLALLRHMAIIVTTGCASKMRADDGLAAAIGPGLGGAEWETVIWSRMVVFRDFAGKRFAGVQKCLGRNLMPLDPTSDVRNAIGFEITEEDGGSFLRPQYTPTVDLTGSSSSPVVVTQPKNTHLSPVNSARKRVYEEIADSDEDADEYGWEEADESAIIAAKELAPTTTTDTAEEATKSTTTGPEPT